MSTDFNWMNILEIGWVHLKRELVFIFFFMCSVLALLSVIQPGSGLRFSAGLRPGNRPWLDRSCRVDTGGAGADLTVEVGTDLSVEVGTNRSVEIRTDWSVEVGNAGPCSIDTREEDFTEAVLEGSLSLSGDPEENLSSTKDGAVDSETWWAWNSSGVHFKTPSGVAPCSF